MSEDLKKRLVTAFVLIALFLGCVVSAEFYPKGWIALAALIVLANGLAAFELSTFCNQSGTAFRRFVYFIAAAFPTLYVVLSLMRGGADGALTLVCSTWFAFLIAAALLISVGYKTLDAAKDVAVDLFIGIFLIGFCGAALLLLASGSNASGLILWLFLTVCVNDSAAYFTGKKIGGPKMAPILSPKKTYSGSIGGFVGGGAAAILGQGLLGKPVSTLEIVFLAMVVVLVAQMGDLTKSYLKRIHNVKDSGNILPGHGGVLDRIDGVLMAAPVLYFWTLL